MSNRVPDPGRRRLVQAGVGLAASLVSLGVLPAAARADGSKEGDGSAADGETRIGPAEDLMREHGVLRRLLLVYDETSRRLIAGEAADVDAVSAAAAMVRRVIEDYHERLEEEQVFPRFRKAGTLVDLVDVLRRQHDAGRTLTDRVLTLTRPKGGRDDAWRHELVAVLATFGRMYRPHASREDTVLFPALHAMVGPQAYAELGEQFEEKERSVLGEGGFEHAVDDVAKLEERLGIHDLDKFTPQVPAT
jgi:hemerythrin-like domain-containing protein